MQETSTLYRQILANEKHWFETTVVIGDSGDLITEHGEKIKFGADTIIVARTGAESGFKEHQLFSVRTTSQMFQNNPEVGNAIAAEIDLTMLKPVSDIPRMGIIVPYVRVCAEESNGTASLVNNNLYVSDAYLDENDYLVLPNATLMNGYVTFNNATETATSEWLKQGVFYIDSRSITHNDDGLDVLEIHGYDAMLKAEQPYATTNLDFPAVDTDVVAEIASIMDVSVDPRTYELMTGGYTLPLPTNYSLREVLGYIASMYVGNFIINDIGELRLVSLLEMPPETRYLIDNLGYAITFGGDRITV